METTGDHSYNAVMRWLADALYRRNIEFDMVSSGERDFPPMIFSLFRRSMPHPTISSARSTATWQKADT